MTAVATARRRALHGTAVADAGFGLYIHWPFCLSKCPYCDFNSHVRETVDQVRWRAALLAELDHYADATGGRRLTSIFFGGGTPSLMDPATAAAAIERAEERWGFAADVEITLEANPTSAEARRFADLRTAGVNRLSLGVQALNDADLRQLGRGHDAAEARTAIGLAGAMFQRYSFDLIYARPDQSVAAWRRELGEAVALAGEHLSAYQLTIEPNTVFAGAHRRGELVLPDEETAAALYETTQDVLADAGLPAYEVSNHARPGAECRHNMTYWRYGDYVGVGPGAHGRLTIDGVRLATRQHRAPEAWLGAVEAQGHATRTRAAVPRSAQLIELVMMGLRLAEGVSRQSLEAIAGRRLEAVFDEAALRRTIDGGFVAIDDAALRATASGRQRLDAVLAALLGSVV